MRQAVRVLLVVCATALFSAPVARAQTPPPPLPGQTPMRTPNPPRQPSLLRVFIDCDFCDGAYLRQEITFVDYMRDRKDADVHVLVTREGTGGGGSSWTLKFIGLGAYADHDHTATFTTPATASSDDQRKEMARIMKLGLISYTMGTPAITQLNVTYTKPAAGAAAAARKKDPWNGLVVKSAGPRFSLGMRTGLSGSTYSNQDLAFSIMPTAEFDVFPYKENARRSLTFAYALGLSYADYAAETIYGKTAESWPRHSVSGGFSMEQPWGSIDSSVSFAQQLNDTTRYRVGVNGEADVRLFKGFSFNVYGDYSRIRDQINLVKGDASTEDVLLRLRQLQSGYSYYLGFGVSYSFGSIFNTVVNPRFNNSGL